MLLVFLAIGLWIVWSAFRVGRVRWSAFATAACATGLYVYIGYHQVMFAGVVGQQQAWREKSQTDLKLYMPADLARQRVLSLACLIRNHMQHPKAGYPASLESPPAGWTCDTRFGKNPIKEFTFSYTPQTDATGGVVSDFRLVAIPNAKGVNNRNPLMIDSRGILFVYYPWEMENARPKVMQASHDPEYSQIDQLKSNIEQYAKTKNAGVAPAQLDAESMGGLGHEMPTIKDGGMRLVTRDFEAVYSPPTATQNGFELSVQCKSYAQNCLRSFFLDSSGVVHGTGEPRQATADDHPSPVCEQFFGECPDVDWSVP